MNIEIYYNKDINENIKEVVYVNGSYYMELPIQSIRGRLDNKTLGHCIVQLINIGFNACAKDEKIKVSHILDKTINV